MASSSSFGPPRQGRASQMTQQEDWIAAKKAEIEAKKQGDSVAGSVDQYQSLEGRMVTASTTDKGKRNSVGIKNRWGFKGKAASSATASSTAIEEKPKGAPKSLAFSNDGSFLEQFKKKMQETPETPSQSLPPVMKEPAVDPSHGGQEQEWYRQALLKAREFASSSAKEPMLKADPGPALKVETSSPPSTSSQVSPLAALETDQQQASLRLQDVELPTVVDELASLVAVNGDQVEVMARERNMEAKDLLFLQDSTGLLYLQYRAKVESLRRGFSEEGKRVRKGTRWGSEEEKVSLPLFAGSNPMLPNPQLAGKSAEVIAYAQKVFGSTDLEEHQWKQCSDQMKMSFVYSAMLIKQQEAVKLALQGKRKYEYDSDEETEGGTWEHKARKLEMEKTATEATKLTEQASGKHHIGDFLPPEELSKFLAKYEAVKNGEAFEESDYQDNKLKEDNMGFKMLQKMGWSEGSGLGANAQGITAPINQGNQSGDKQGLGTLKSHDLEQEDNEFDAYRKRMMLAYRFRPNPLNNPRRSYY